MKRSKGRKGYSIGHILLRIEAFNSSQLIFSAGFLRYSSALSSSKCTSESESLWFSTSFAILSQRVSANRTRSGRLSFNRSDIAAFFIELHKDKNLNAKTAAPPLKLR